MSSNVMFALKEYFVGENCDYTLDKLKEEYEFPNDKALVNFLLRTLKEELEMINYYEIEEKLVVIRKIFDHLTTFIVENRKCDIENVAFRLKYLETYVASSLLKLKTNIRTSSTTTITIQNFWNDIRQNIDQLLQLIEYKKEFNNNDYSFLTDLVYNIKNIDLLINIVSLSPMLLLTKDTIGNSFFSHLIEFYVDLLKDKTTKLNDIVYFEKVINLFLNNKKLKVEKQLKDYISVGLDQMRRTRKLDKEVFDQRKIFLVHLRKKIMGEKKYVYDEKELYSKYFITKIINNNDENTTCFNDLKNNYHDFTDKKVITIDPTNALDLDDGISIDILKNNNYLLGLYIADASYYVPYNSYDDLIAFQKSVTIYSNNLTLPMLPNNVTYENCSLLPNNMRKTIAYFFEIEPDGNIKNHFIKKGIIKTRDNLHFSYQQVDDILSKGSNDTEIYNILYDLQRLSDIDIFRKMKTEYRNEFGKMGAYSIVNKFMVFANHIVALDARSEKIPFIYRTHRTVDLQAILDSNCCLKDFVLRQNDQNARSIAEDIISNCFSRAYYTTTALPHEGLKLSAYAHTTSPLRRYIDLVNQRLIKLFLIDKLRDDKRMDAINSILEKITNDIDHNQLINEQFCKDYAHILKK